MASKTKALVLALVAMFSLMAVPASASVSQSASLKAAAAAAATPVQTAPTVVAASGKTTYITTASGARRYAYKAISTWRTYAAWHSKKGMAKTQYGCLVNLWTKESHWNRHAGHVGGAYGIPQSLPGKKMAANGRDWRHNAATQVRWGLHYIKVRYKTPCGAWYFWIHHNWY